MEPVCLRENRYSYLVANWRPGRTSDYQAQAPEAAFERQVQDAFAERIAESHDSSTTDPDVIPMGV